MSREPSAWTTNIASIESSQLFVVTDANGVIDENAISISSGGAAQITSLQ